jgi:hypothetical protein
LLAKGRRVDQNVVYGGMILEMCAADRPSGMQKVTARQIVVRWSRLLRLAVVI